MSHIGEPVREWEVEEPSIIPQREVEPSEEKIHEVEKEESEKEKEEVEAWR